MECNPNLPSIIIKPNTNQYSVNVTFNNVKTQVPLSYICLQCNKFFLFFILFISKNDLLLNQKKERKKKDHSIQADTSKI